MPTNSATGISLFDVFALIWFVGIWFGYVRYTKYKSLKQNKGLLAAMNRKRKECGAGDSGA